MIERDSLTESFFRIRNLRGMERELSDSSMDDPLEILGSGTVGAEATAEDDLFMEVDGASALKGNAATAEDWRKALDKVVPSVVVLRTSAPRAFDTYAAGSFHATGFVVDKRRGIILTNRHVVRPGRKTLLLLKVKRVLDWLWVRGHSTLIFLHVYLFGFDLHNFLVSL